MPPVPPTSVRVSKQSSQTKTSCLLRASVQYPVPIETKCWTRAALIRCFTGIVLHCLDIKNVVKWARSFDTGVHFSVTCGEPHFHSGRATKRGFAMRYECKPCSYSLWADRKCQWYDEGFVPAAKLFMPEKVSFLVEGGWMLHSLSLKFHQNGTISRPRNVTVRFNGREQELVRYKCFQRPIGRPNCFYNDVMCIFRGPRRSKSPSSFIFHQYIRWNGGKRDRPAVILFPGFSGKPLRTCGYNLIEWVSKWFLCDRQYPIVNKMASQVRLLHS